MFSTSVCTMWQLFIYTSFSQLVSSVSQSGQFSLVWSVNQSDISVSSGQSASQFSQSVRSVSSVSQFSQFSLSVQSVQSFSDAIWMKNITDGGWQVVQQGYIGLKKSYIWPCLIQYYFMLDFSPSTIYIMYLLTSTDMKRMLLKNKYHILLYSGILLSEHVGTHDKCLDQWVFQID